MQPSEMTNEKILSLAELCFFEDHSVEEDQQTAAVLRDYVRMRRQIAELRAALEVVKYALGESRIAICHICNIKHTCGHGTAKFDPCCIIKHIDSAIAAIRGVGGAE